MCAGWYDGVSGSTVPPPAHSRSIRKSKMLNTTCHVEDPLISGRTGRLLDEWISNSPSTLRSSPLQPHAGQEEGREDQGQGEVLLEEQDVPMGASRV